MPTVQPIDAVTEHRLLGALTDVSNHVADGDEPNDAICKVASAKQLSPGQTELVIRAYNTGRTQFQFTNGNSLAEKLASFPLADPDVVLGKLFPKEVKTASQERHEVAVDSDYATSPKSWLNRVRLQEKAAGDAELITQARREVKVAHSNTIDHTLDNQHEQFLMAKQEVSKATQAVIRAKYAAHEALQELVGYFKESKALPLVAVQKNASLALGQRAGKLLDMVAAELPQHGTFAEELQKLAGTPVTPAAPAKVASHLVDWSKAPYSLIEACLNKTAAYALAEQNSIAVEKTAKEVQDLFLGPFSEQPQTAVITGSVWADQSSPSETKEAGWLSPVIGAGIGATVNSSMKSLNDSMTGNREAQIKSHLGKLQDPAHEQQLQDIRTQSMLADMLQNDPVIGGYPQDHVLDAYSRLSEVAPSAVQHRVLAQTMLRKYLEQGNQLADFDVDQLLGIEGKLRPPQKPQQAPAPPK